MKEIPIVNGDIFESGAQMIAHQVNCQGVMGSGIAKQVKEKYPEVFKQYKNACDNAEKSSDLLGYILPVNINQNQQIINLFAQDRYGYNGKKYTDYDALQRCLNTLNLLSIHNKSIAIPYKMSCDRGGGDWEKVSKMIAETLSERDVTFYKFGGK